MPTLTIAARILPAEMGPEDLPIPKFAERVGSAMGRLFDSDSGKGRVFNGEIVVRDMQPERA
jgi:hypothetical protein